MRIGHGYDVHRFEAGNEVVLGAVHIPFTQGLAAHSDGDHIVGDPEPAPGRSWQRHLIHTNSLNSLAIQ